MFNNLNYIHKRNKHLDSLTIFEKLLKLSGNVHRLPYQLQQFYQQLYQQPQEQFHQHPYQQQQPYQQQPLPYIQQNPSPQTGIIIPERPHAQRQQRHRHRKNPHVSHQSEMMQQPHPSIGAFGPTPSALGIENINIIIQG